MVGASGYRRRFGLLHPASELSWNRHVESVGVGFTFIGVEDERQDRLAVQSLPDFALFEPVGFNRDLADFTFFEFRSGLSGWFEIKNGLLNVGGKLGEVEDLSDSGAGDACGASDLGLVFNLTSGEEVVEADSERH